MAWPETPTYREQDRGAEQLAEQKRKAQELLEQQRASESPEAKRTKEILVSALPSVKSALARQNAEMDRLIAELKEKEYNVSDSFSGMMKSFGNFTSPENLMWLSTLVRWDGKTNTGERLDTIESFQSRAKIQYSSLLRIEYALSIWQRLEDIQKDRSMVAFFIGAEGKYILALASWMPPEQAMQEYNLNKARELKNFIINGNLLAESYYDKLKGTQYEQQADKERMGKLEYFHKKWLSDFWNTFLSLDQLGLLVTWWVIWKWVWATVAISPKLAQVSVQATEKLSNSIPWVLTRAIPWVNAIKTQAGEWVAMSLWKFGINFSLEVWKFAWYEAIARKLWWDDTAKIVAMLMIVIPWAKEGFTSSLRGKVVKDMNLKWEFVKWIQENYWEAKVKQMLYAGLVETKAQAGKMTKVWYDEEVWKTVDVMIASILAKTEPIKQAVGQVSQVASHTPTPQAKWTDTLKTTPPEIPKEQPLEKPGISVQEKAQWVQEATRYKTLYEDPEYAFLAWERYTKLREVFPNLSHKDIIWEWNNWIILKHPDGTKVIKIAKEWSRDKLDIEAKNHKEFRNALIALQKEFADNPAFAYLKKFRIPRIAELEWMQWVYEMEKVSGLSLKSLVTLKYHSKSLQDMPENFYKGMNDAQVESFLKERWLKVYPRNQTEIDNRWLSDSDRAFMIDLEREWDNLFKWDITNLEKLFKERWFYHNDLHWWNVMQTDDWTMMYIIDFGRSRILPTNK